VIRPAGIGSDAHLYGTIAITAFEAFKGTSKLVNIPWGFQKRMIRVKVPPGVKDGSKLRLKGLGKITPDGQRGDLFLKVAIA
jgi:curved DNA-binding protein CbpA